jgi:hypothetical protein
MGTNNPTPAQSGEHVLYGVEVWNLHVMITHDDGSWFAQGGEVDYAAQGDNLEDVKARFQSGLCSTLHEHLTVYGHLDHINKPAPGDVWAEVVKAAQATNGQHEYSALSLHLTPSVPFYNGIKYTILQKAA